jgi:hypothetical protein
MMPNNSWLRSVQREIKWSTQDSRSGLKFKPHPSLGWRQHVPDKSLLDPNLVFAVDTMLCVYAALSPALQSSLCLHLAQ